VEHFSDRLAASVVARRSLVCVGLDPALERMPPALLERHRPAAMAGDDEAVAACFAEFCAGVIEAVAGTAACVKPQAAFFEQYGAAGWRALTDTVACAHAHDLPVILDVKRGDIASTGAAYRRAAFGGAPGFTAPVAGVAADAVTVSPYLGDDSLTPFTDACAEGRGVFVLVRTSNPGAGLLQELDVDGRPLYLHVADTVARLGAAHVGAQGYSDVGAVVGATAPAALRAVRAVLPRAFLLVPGVGAQGGATEALGELRTGDAGGLVVNASRSIIYAWQQGDADYRRAAADAAEALRRELGPPA
jgi:orotidine-5'-phosphate decarboxylase